MVGWSIPACAGKPNLYTRTAPPLAAEAVKALAAYDWPGNVREQQNVLAQVSLSAREGETVGRAALPEEVRRAARRDWPTLAELRKNLELGIERTELNRLVERFAPSREQGPRER